MCRPVWPAPACPPAGPGYLLAAVAASKRITIDRSKHLNQEPGTGHNRWHPELVPVVEVEDGEQVTLETRDALDGYLNAHSTAADFGALPLGAIHPLTGPVYVKGASPGDLLEVEFIDIQPQPWAFSAIMPGLGFLRDVMTDPFLVHWQIADGWATSAQIPGVRIPQAAFMGVSGVAPSLEQVAAWAKREAAAASRGGFALPPNPADAVPAGGAAANDGLSTLPPRENGGNFDVKQLTRGSKLLLPVNVDGALFSTGDAHFAQGDGEVCVTAVEMAATCSVRFAIHRGEAARHNIRWPRFARTDDFTDPRWGMPRRFVATMGMPVDDDGTNHAEDLNSACRHAVLNMLDLLEERGFTRQQAYVLCSVAVDLRISNVVDVPNYVVSALLPEDIFEG
jgi:formamidase